MQNFNHPRGYQLNSHLNSRKGLFGFSEIALRFCAFFQQKMLPSIPSNLSPRLLMQEHLESSFGVRVPQAIYLNVVIVFEHQLLANLEAILEIFFRCQSYGMMLGFYLQKSHGGSLEFWLEQDHGGCVFFRCITSLDVRPRNSLMQ